MDLNSILEEVARGKMGPNTARKLIDKLDKKMGGKSAPHSEGSKRDSSATGTPGDQKAAGPQESEASDSKEGFRNAFDRLKKSVHIDELIKISSGIVHQIAENMPNQIEKIQENFSANLNTLGFSANNNGVESRLSVFRTFHVSSDSQVAENQVVGSQWFGVNFAETAEVKKNKFAAVQFSEVAIVRSNLCSNNMSLSRLSNVTLQEARFESNRISRTTFSDVSITEADFTNNKLVKSEFAQTVINGSRLAGNQFVGVDFTECEFDGCDIQGILFENCKFSECAFHKIEINAIERGAELVKIVNRSFTGKTVTNCNSVEKLLAALEADDVAVEEPKPEVRSEVRETKSREPKNVESEPIPRHTRSHSYQGGHQSEKHVSEGRNSEPRSEYKPREARARAPRDEARAEPRSEARPQAPHAEERSDDGRHRSGKSRSAGRNGPRDDISG